MKTISYRVKQLILLVISSFLLVVLLLTVSPPQEGLIITSLPLLLIWVIVFSFFSLMFSYRNNANHAITATISASFATITTLVVMFSALGQLNSFDMGVFLLLSIVGVFYIQRTWQR